MQFKVLVVSLAVAMAAATSASALTIHTSNHLSSVTNANGFEGMGSTSSFTGPYTEDGITVEYIGTASIWTDSQPAAEGSYSWYENGGGTGYTKIKLSNGDDIDGIQFFAGSGWFGGNGGLNFALYNDGALVVTGNAGAVPDFPNGFVKYGFSGEIFDEVRLQVLQGGGGFNDGALDAGAYDLIEIGASGGVVPEPATWALMIGGFGLAGAALRRRRTVTA